MQQQGSIADRQCLRVAAPRGLLLEAALWVRDGRIPPRLTLEELGLPALRHPGCAPLVIDDISANGLRLTLAQPGCLGPREALLRSGRCLCLLYLKLSQPLTSQEERPLSLLLGAQPVIVREDEDRLVVAMSILLRGQPERDDKALNFFNVAKNPIRELAAWCDEVLRLERSGAPAAPRGLRLERLLPELDALLAGPRTAE